MRRNVTVQGKDVRITHLELQHAECNISPQETRADVSVKNERTAELQSQFDILDEQPWGAISRCYGRSIGMCSLDAFIAN